MKLYQLPTLLDAANPNTVSSQINFQHQLLATEADPQKAIFKIGQDRATSISHLININRDSTIKARSATCSNTLKVHS